MNDLQIRWAYLQNDDTDLSFFHYKFSDAEITRRNYTIMDESMAIMDESMGSSDLLSKSFANLSDSFPQIWSPVTPMEFALYPVVSHQM